MIPNQENNMNAAREVKESERWMVNCTSMNEKCTNMKNILHGIKSRLDAAEEKTGKSEDKAREIHKMKEGMVKKKKKTEKNPTMASMSYGTVSRSLIYRSPPLPAKDMFQDASGC